MNYKMNELRKLPHLKSLKIKDLASKKLLSNSVSYEASLISKKKNILEFFLSNETLIRSKFNNIKIGDKINLEQPLRKGQDISGHICQGHVDTVGKVLRIKKIDKSFLFDFELPKKQRKCLFLKSLNHYKK